MPCQTMKEAVEQLFYWQNGTKEGGNPDNFTALIYRLYHKGDLSNVMALKKGFPSEYEAWHEWMCTSDPKEFFKKYGCGFLYSIKD